MHDRGGPGLEERSRRDECVYEVKMVALEDLEAAECENGQRNGAVDSVPQRNGI